MTMAYGISAQCEDGSIALITLTDRRVRVACEKPSSVAKCNALLARISIAR